MDREKIKEYTVELKAAIDPKTRELEKRLKETSKRVKEANKAYEKGDLTLRKYNKISKEVKSTVADINKEKEKLNKTSAKALKLQEKQIGLEQEGLKLEQRLAHTRKMNSARLRRMKIDEQGIMSKYGARTTGSASLAEQKRRDQAAMFEQRRAQRMEMLRLRSQANGGGGIGSRMGGGRGSLAAGGLFASGMSAARVFSPGLPALAAPALAAYGGMRIAQRGSEVMGNQLAFQMTEGSRQAGNAAFRSYVGRSNEVGVGFRENTTNFLNLKTALKAQKMEGQAEDIFFNFAEYGNVMGATPERMQKAMMAVGQMAGY